MKKRSIGWKLLILGSMMTLAVGCQPKTPKAPANRFAEVNQVCPHSDNVEQDIDEAVYGTNDTSSSNQEIAQPDCDSAQVISDMQEVFAESIVPIFAEVEAANVVVLEAVNSIDIEPQYQEAVSESSQN